MISIWITNKPTRTTKYTTSIIDHILTNSIETVADTQGVLPLFVNN